MPGNGINPNNNLIKQQDIEELWYKTIGPNMGKGKVNLTTNEDFKKAVLANFADYVQEVKQKDIPVVFEKPITLEQNQNMHVVCLGNAHLFDLSNPPSDLDRVAFKEALLDKDPKDVTVAFFTGGMRGKEWKIGNLNNATIDGNGKIQFWGIVPRDYWFVRYIECAIQNGAKYIFVMNGREEHEANQKLGTDLLAKIVEDKFNDDLMELMINRLNKKSEIVEKNVKIYYVRGVKKVFNIDRKNGNGTNSHYTMSMHTNLKTLSGLLDGNLKAAEKQHAGLAAADQIIIQGENVYGAIDERHIHILTGQGTYQSSVKGNLPAPAPKGKNSFTLLFGPTSHDTEFVWTMKIKSNTYDIQRKAAELREQEKFLVDLCKQKINDKHKEFARAQTSKDFYQYYK